jgi:exonuclease III
MSERILTACFKGNVRNVTVIQYYAPTEGTQIGKRQAFYSQLSRVATDSSKRDSKIVMGNLNAEVGTENEGLEHVMGRRGKNGIN